MFAADLAPGLVTACAIAPALLLLWLVVAADSRPEPPRVVWACVALGAVSVLPVAVVEFWLLHLLPFSADPLWAAGEKALLIAALPEEAAKIAIIAAIALKSRAFDEPMDGVVYGTAVGLGFAAVENFLYVRGNAHLAMVAGLRGVLSVPFTARSAPSPAPTLPAPGLAARSARTRGTVGRAPAGSGWPSSYRWCCIGCSIGVCFRSACWPKRPQRRLPRAPAVLFP